LASEDIVVQLARDVDGTYPRLWSIYLDPLYAYVVRRIRNEEDARDIMQDIFERAYRALKRYSAERILMLQLRPWLYTIAENACLNYQTRYRASLPLSLDILEGSASLDILDTSSELPDVIAETHEIRQELLLLIAKLPKKYQTALIWHFFNELSYNEIAAKLHLKAATIRIHVHRGLSLLRRMLIEQQKEQDKKREVHYDK
jgi:RNA polymerase sigma-70 factor, ECF subfamily